MTVSDPRERFACGVRVLSRPDRYHIHRVCQQGC